MTEYAPRILRITHQGTTTALILQDASFSLLEERIRSELALADQDIYLSATTPYAGHTLLQSDADLARAVEAGVVDIDVLALPPRMSAPPSLSPVIDQEHDEEGSSPHPHPHSPRHRRRHHHHDHQAEQTTCCHADGCSRSASEPIVDPAPTWPELRDRAKTLWGPFGTAAAKHWVDFAGRNDIPLDTPSHACHLLKDSFKRVRQDFRERALYCRIGPLLILLFLAFILFSTISTCLKLLLLPILLAVVPGGFKKLIILKVCFLFFILPRCFLTTAVIGIALAVHLRRRMCRSKDGCHRDHHQRKAHCARKMRDYWTKYQAMWQ